MKPTINSDAEPERLEDIVVKKDKDVEEVVRIYHSLDVEKLNNKWWNDIRGYYSQKNIPVLIPTQIDFVLQRIIQETITKQTNDRITGLYITHLIQESYTAGNNNFTLNTKDTTIDNLAHDIIGAKERPLKLAIQGNTGYFCGEKMSGVIINVNGSVGDYCGQSAQQSEIIVSRNAGEYFGRDAKHMKLTIHKRVHNGCAYHANCVDVTLHAQARDDCGYGARDSTFKFTNKLAYDRFKKTISASNKIFLIDTQGNIIEKR